MDETRAHDRKLRMAMIGGGPDGQIGATHRRAARLDGQIDLVAGAFSSDPEKSREQGRRLYLDPARVYGDWREMIRAEAAMPRAERVDFISIVTPNFLHFDPAREALSAGFHVILDKPMTLTVEEAEELHRVAMETGKVFALTHTYVAYPMAKAARDLVRGGRLGKIRKIVAEYLSGYLSANVEADPANKQAAWRTDPARAGSGCLGDIGTHAAILAESVSGLKMVEIAADVSTFVEGRRTDDDVNMLVRWEGGAKGVLHASAVATGEENEIAVYVYGDKASLEWQHCDCERLKIRYPDRPMEVWSRGWNYVRDVSPDAARCSRLFPDQPEGMIEAFANIYMNAAAAMREVDAGRPLAEVHRDYPDSFDGMRGMRFIAAALESSRNNGRWTKLE